MPRHEQDGDRIELLVSVDDAHAAAIDEVAQDLKRAGMDVEDALPEIGTVIGRGRRDMITGLQGVKGVKSVSPGRTFGIAPPDAIDQ